MVKHTVVNEYLRFGEILCYKLLGSMLIDFVPNMCQALNCFNCLY